MVTKASSTSSVIHVPSWPGRYIFLHLPITSLNALLIVKSNAFLFNNGLTLLLILISDGNKTNLGSGLHQRMSSPSYHGKMPLRLANNNLSGDKSPPIASNP